MRIIADCHNDTPYELFYKKENLYDNNLSISIKKLENYKTLLFYSIYMDFEKYGNNPKKYFCDIYNYFENQLSKNEKFIYKYKNIETFFNDSRHAAVITLEGGDFIKSEKDIDYLKSLGIKVITLTWNKKNALASSVADEKDEGLSELGKKILLKMEQSDIIPDFSHSSDRTFFEGMEVLKKPAFITHSNSRAVIPNKRNITDEMFLRLIKNGGVCGINLYRDFAGKDISSLKKHIYHFLSLGGENNIAFGSDFDGAYPLTAPIKDFRQMDLIINGLLKDNLNEETVRKISYKNVFEILGGKRIWQNRQTAK